MKVCMGVNPADDSDIFRIGAADEILRLLVDAHEEEFTIPELVEATEVTRSTVWRAVDLLDSLDILRIRETPQRNYISIDPGILKKDDPILTIEQPTFHEPVRAFVQKVRDVIGSSDEVHALVGIVLFGSVARGEADRKSDIDLFVVIDGDRTVARRLVADVVEDLQETRFDGDRYEFEQYVESVESASRAGKKLQEIFDEGITIYQDTGLQDVRKAVFTDE
jgi:predicted nucleotidyltransferase